MHSHSSASTLIATAFAVVAWTFAGALAYDVYRLHSANHLFADRATQLATDYNRLVSNHDTLLKVAVELQRERDDAIEHGKVMAAMAGMGPAHVATTAGR